MNILIQLVLTCMVIIPKELIKYEYGSKVSSYIYYGYFIKFYNYRCNMLSHLHARDHQYKGNTAYSIQLYIEYTPHHDLNL